MMKKSWFITIGLIVLAGAGLAAWRLSRASVSRDDVMVSPTPSSMPSLIPEASPSPAQTLTPTTKVSPSPKATPMPTSRPSPTPAPAPTPTSAVILKTVTITSTGFSPSVISIPVGGTVRFINQDTQLHWPASSPHPAHTTCLGFDALGGLAQGQAYEFTFTIKKDCSYHDHLHPSLTGTIKAE